MKPKRVQHRGIGVEDIANARHSDTGRKLSKTSRAHMVSAVSSFYAWALEEGYVVTNPEGGSAEWLYDTLYCARGQAENLIKLKLLSHEAQKRSIDKQPKVQQQLAFQRENILAAAAFQDLQQTAKVDDAEIQKYYDQHKNEYEQLKARHILIRVKGAPMPAAGGKQELTDEAALAKAQEIEKRLAAGEDFAKVAQTESDDSVLHAQILRGTT